MRLSIGIPTYNFGKYIGETLASIIPNLTDDVEVIVFDGGSTDNTAQVVAQIQQECPCIKYYKQNYRGGIDRDIATLVGLLQGEYCWLFSADDYMKPGAVKKVLDVIKSNKEVYLCELTFCDYEMKPLRENPIFRTRTMPELFDLKVEEQRKKYFRNARTSEAFFSFLAGPVFRKDVWDKATDVPESFYHTCWGLAGRILSHVPQGLSIYYLGESLLYRRGENDSFLDKGVVNRLRISVDGFTHVAETIFGKNSFETYHIRRVIRNERSLLHLLFLKLQVVMSQQCNDKEELNKIVCRHYSNSGILNKLKYFFFRMTPIFIIRLGDALRRVLLRKRILIPLLVLFGSYHLMLMSRIGFMYV